MSLGHRRYEVILAEAAPESLAAELRSKPGLQTERAMLAYATTTAAVVALARNVARDAVLARIRVKAGWPRLRRHAFQRAHLVDLRRS